MSERIYCNRNWRFSPTFDGWMIERPIDGYTPVTLPHTVKEIPYNYYNVGELGIVCCYQKILPVPAQWDGKRVAIVIEAVAGIATVYVNGQIATGRETIYAAEDVDISELLNYGEENIITIRVDSKAINAKRTDDEGFVACAGIYREVYFEVSDKARMYDVVYRPTLLEKVNTSRLAVDGISTFTTLGIVKTTAKVSRQVYELAMLSRINVTQYLDDRLLFEQPVSHLEKDGDDIYMSLSSAPVSVKLWDVVSPTIYTIRTKFTVDGSVVDEIIDSVGFRNIESRPDGFFLNGRAINIRGLVTRQTFPYVGSAMPESMLRYDALLAQEELGASAVRILKAGQYYSKDYFIEECDKTGVLVFTDAKDVAWHSNHPCIVEYDDGDTWHFTDMCDYISNGAMAESDGICACGLMDMFRNKKPAANAYAAEGVTDTPILFVSSDFRKTHSVNGACDKAYITTNSEKVRMYRNGILLKEYNNTGSETLKHAPILIDDYVGASLLTEDFSKAKAKLVKQCLNNFAMRGISKDNLNLLTMLRLKLFYDLDYDGIVRLYHKYVLDYYKCDCEYKFEAITDDKVDTTITLSSVQSVHIKAKASHTLLTEDRTYDVAEIRLEAVDENDNLLTHYNEPVMLSVTGPIEIIGPKLLTFRGGLTGVYIRTIGEEGNASLLIEADGLADVKINFDIERLR